MESGVAMCPMAPKTLRYRRTKRAPERRGTSTERGYDQEWRDFREWWLPQHLGKGNVYCAWCGKPLDGSSKSMHVDHKVPHRGNRALKYDEGNLQVMHAACHSAKTVRKDGGFGRTYFE